MSTQFGDEFLRAIPKTDLHVHLDGSLRIPTLIELAKERGITLPAQDEAGLNEEVFRPHYRNLEEYLEGFAWTVRVMQDEAALERVAYEFAIDTAQDNVRYVEVRFAPQLHMHDSLSFEQIMHAVDAGLRRGRDEINARDDGQPPFEYGIIVCAMRYVTPDYSAYYRELFRIHRYADEREVIRLASINLAQATVKLRQETDVQVVGFDLAGSEYGYPASAHEEAFDLVHQNFLHTTVHAGEAYGPQSIFQAVTKLHADRIGHGLHLFDAKMIVGDRIADKDRYIEDLADYIAHHRLTIEVCLTSNLQTSPHLSSLAQHSLREMLRRRLSVTICTDNRLVSHTTVSDELRRAIDEFEIDAKLLKDIIIYGFKRSFYYRPYPQKRKYVRSVIDAYDRIAAEFGVG